MTTSADTNAVRRWLLLLWALVLAMAVIGAITRLSGSGLSIVEWQPVSGVLPPLDDRSWQEAFAAYQASPQFRELNHWMSLADFKRIFFWEYLHRLFGRLIGVACLLPWLYFVARRRMSAKVARRSASVFFLGGLQGVVGWYMVKSGLVHEPRVSHFRLALHLLMAFGVGQWILWQALDLGAPRRRAPHGTASRLALGFVALLVLQVVYGAFMAGTQAGHLFSTFPDMNGRYAPFGFFRPSRLAYDLVNNPLSIHYLHRLLALLALGYGAWLVHHLHARMPALRGHALALALVLVLQLVLGALTVVLHVPIALAVAHQVGAYLLLSTAVCVWHATRVVREAHHEPEARARDGGLAGTGQDLDCA